MLQEQAGKESDAKHEEEEDDGDIKNFDLVKDKDKTLYKELGLAAAALAPLLRVIVNVPPLRYHPNMVEPIRRPRDDDGW